MSARPLLMKVRSLISGFSLSHWFVTCCIKVGFLCAPKYNGCGFPLLCAYVSFSFYDKENSQSLPFECAQDKTLASMQKLTNHI